MQGLYVVRQPVYTRTQYVIGYKLWFQPEVVEHGLDTDQQGEDSYATLDALIELGFDSLVGARSAFIRFSQAFICAEPILPLPAERVVIELDEYEQPDEQLINGVKRLSDMGYTIALDRFVLKDPVPPMLALADIVKIDAGTLTDRELRRQHRAMTRFHGVKVLASGVDGQARYEFCREIGFNYFQGHFFTHARSKLHRRVPANRVSMMRLLADLHKSNASVSYLEALVSKDVGLSYKLLRYINSSFFGLPRTVDSIQRAIVFLGTKAIQKWATLLVLARVDNKPNELMVTALVRAKMCELLAQIKRMNDVDVCFTAGLLSVLEALLDTPMEQVLTHLSLNHALNRALLVREGEIGSLLRDVIHYETRAMDEIDFSTLKPRDYRDAYVQSVKWASDNARVLIGE